MRPLVCAPKIHFLEDPLMNKKMFRTVFDIRVFFFCSSPIRALLRLPSCFGEVLERKQTRNSSAISRYSGATSATPEQFQKCLKPKLCHAISVFACVCWRTYLPRNESSSKHLCINGSGWFMVSRAGRRHSKQLNAG